ncbi:FEKKY domain-containing protein [Tenacibaculum geojense]
MSLAENCNSNKKTAYSDFKNKKLKLYVSEENKNDKKLEIQNIKKEYSLEYIYFKEIKLFDCYLEYNNQILKILTLKYGREILNRIDKDVIGLE